jgi:hypothetical protein
MLMEHVESITGILLGYSWEGTFAYHDRSAHYLCYTCGQVTDDSELALALASALDGSDPHRGFPADRAAALYEAWLDSYPFDVGEGCAGSRT